MKKKNIYIDYSFRKWKTFFNLLENVFTRFDACKSLRSFAYRPCVRVCFFLHCFTMDVAGMLEKKKGMFDEANTSQSRYLVASEACMCGSRPVAR